MPLLDIVTAQTSWHNNLGPFRSQSLLRRQILSSPFCIGDEKKLLFISKSCRFPKRVNAHERSRLVIKAVATLEPKCMGQKEGGHHHVHQDGQLDVSSDASVAHPDSAELDEREKLRRMRISKANKGNTPWNKGRKHSPETLQRIRERTKLAMQNPKIKMKLANLGHAQSKETRMKIGLGVRMGWQKRREKQLVQETCYYEWQNLIAAASRKGYVGEEELQWDLYKIISEKLELEWVQGIEQRKMMPRPKGSKRAPKSPEQRRKIAEAIAAKWADPEYRERVCSGLAKYHGTPLGAERKPRRKPSGGTQSTRRDPMKKKTSDANSPIGIDASSTGQRMKLRRSKTPLYKDPLASSKLEMIKGIRAQRAVEETKKTEAIERARLLIAEAQKAAKALEVAALKNPIAQASLVETRKLIAEAIQSIESIGAEHINLDKNVGCLALYPVEQEGNMGKESGVAEMRGTNGTKLLASMRDEDLNLSNLKFHDVASDGKDCLLHTGGVVASLSMESFMEHSRSGEGVGQLEARGKGKSEKKADALLNGCTVELKMENVPSKSNKAAKKWVRGRLVEGTDES